MRKVEKHVAKDGTVTYFVRFRLDGASTSTTFRGPPAEAKRQATEFAGMVHAIGPAAALEWQRRNDTHDAPATTSMTLNDWAELYIAQRTGVTDGTRHGYQRTHALGYGKLIGHLPLDAITRGDIAGAMNYMTTHGGRKGKGYSDKTIANAHGLLSSMLTEAVWEGHVATNPSTRIKLPRTDSGDDQRMFLMSQDEFTALVEAAPEHYRPLILTLGGTGMRWGEAEALEVRDVNLDKATVRINKAAKWDTRLAQRTIGPTKTKHSVRTVTLPETVVEALRPLVEGRGRTARLFLAPRGGPLRHKAFWEYAWVRSCEKVGLTDPRPTPHDCRHSHASWLIEAGVPLAVISRRLGHHSITITVDTYGHLSPDIQRAAADAAELVLRPRLALMTES